MKKILFALLLIGSLPVLAQTGTGWQPLRYKVNYRDSVYFYKDANFIAPIRIDGVTVTPDAAELNILDGALVNTTELNRLVGVTSAIQSQINNKAPIANPQFTGTVRIGTDTAATRNNARQTAADSIQKLIDDAYPIEDYLAGGGGGQAKKYRLQFRVDTTDGAPSAGDSTFTDTQLIGMAVNVWHNGLYKNFKDKNYYVKDCIEFNSTQGKITFHLDPPKFATNDWVMIHYTNTILYEDVSITGEESSILDNLISYYNCDETSGVILNDAHGSNDGDINGATVNSTGILGKAVDYDGVDDNTTIPYNSSLVPTDSLAVSLWFYADELPSTLGHSSYLFRQMHGESPWETTSMLIYNYSGDNYLYGKFVDSDGDSFFVEYSTPITTGSYYHVVMVNRGNGNDCELWINGTKVDVTTSFDGSMFAATGDISIGNSYEPGDEGFSGKIDEILISNGLAPAEIVDLWNSGTGKTYPFAE